MPSVDWGKWLRLGACALSALQLCGGSGRRDVADQGSRQYRGRTAEPAGWLWPRRRPERHRRYAQQHPLHQAIAASDAGTHGCQHPRRYHPHRQRRRRHGDRQPAAIRDPGNPHGRDGFRARRLQEPARRHPPRHSPARRRRQRLCGGAGLGHHQRVPGRRRRRQHHPRRADRRPDSQRRHHRTRDRIRAQSPAQCTARAAQRRFHHRQAHRGRGQ